MKRKSRLKPSDVDSEVTRGSENTCQEFECPLCRQMVKSRNNLNAHIRSHTNEKPWQCSVCKVSYKHNNSLKAHQFSKHGQYGETVVIYQCDQCDHKTISFKLHKQHLRGHSEDRPFACSFPGCSSAYKQAMILKSHVKLQHCEEVTEFKCPRPGCTYKTKREYHIRGHLKRVHGPSEEIPCIQTNCSFIAKNQECLKSHMKSHGSRQLQCPVPGCTGAFKTAGALSIHQRVHDPSCQFECDLCPHRFKSAGALSRHRSMKHTEETEMQSYNCPFCNYKTKFQSNFAQHIQGWHKADPFKCPETGCPYRSHSADMLKMHKSKMHNSASEFVCKLCSFRFKRQLYLEIHTRTVHEGKKDFQCLQCDYRTTSQFKVEVHVRNKHTGNATLTEIKPESAVLSAEAIVKVENADQALASAKYFFCDEPDCIHISYNQSSLDMHRKLHSNIRRFQCHLCSRRYSNNGKITRHLQEFHGEGPSFVCSEPGCDYKAFSQVSLDFHNKFHDKSRPLTCPQCPKRFHHKISLKAHIEFHAKELLRSTVPYFEPLPCLLEVKPEPVERGLDEKPPQTLKDEIFDQVQTPLKVIPCTHPDCEYVFYTQTTLGAHLKFHDQARQYPCEYCQLRYMRKHDLLIHVRRWHGNGEDQCCEVKCS